MRCVTIHLCQCFVRVKAVVSCEYDSSSSSDDSRGGPYVSIRKSSPVASIHKCVWELFFRFILQTWEQEGHWEIEFVSV